MTWTSEYESVTLSRGTQLSWSTCSEQLVGGGCLYWGTLTIRLKINVWNKASNVCQGWTWKGHTKPEERVGVGWHTPACLDSLAVDVKAGLISLISLLLLCFELCQALECEMVIIINDDYNWPIRLLVVIFIEHRHHCLPGHNHPLASDQGSC